MKNPRYDDLGQRVTDCCGTYSTYVDVTLCCKSCYQEVNIGQGDGTEFREGVTEDEYFAAHFAAEDQRIVAQKNRWLTHLELGRPSHFRHQDALKRAQVASGDAAVQAVNEALRLDRIGLDLEEE
jgi:hypothetical protein